MCVCGGGAVQAPAAKGGGGGVTSDTGWQLQVALGSSGAVQSCAPSALSTAMEDLSTARDAPASGPAASGTSMDDDDRTEPSRADTVAASSPTVSLCIIKGSKEKGGNETGGRGGGRLN